MEQNYFFPRDSILPSFWANRIQDFISSLGQFRLQLASATVIEVPAGPEDAAVSIGIEKRWRFVEATVQRAHPGGAAGTYSVWVTASENDVTNAPDPFTDGTDYSFDLAITANNVPPAAVPGVVDIWREVAKITWDGAAITGVDPLIGADPGAHAGSHAAGGSDPVVGPLALSGGAGVNLYRSKRTGDVTDAFVIGERGAMEWGDGANPRDVTLFRPQANVLATGDTFSSALDMIARGAAAAQVVAGAGGPASEAGLKLGLAGDVNLYRLAADILKTDDDLYVAGQVLSYKNVYVDYGNTGNKILFGSAQDVNLYRSAADVLRTDDAFQAMQLSGRALATTDFPIVSFVAGDSQNRFQVRGTGEHQWGSGALTPDTNLYRSAVDTLKTDDTFRAALGIIARDNVATEQVAIGGYGPATQAGVLFGSAGDTNLYRSAADLLASQDDLSIRRGQAEQLYLGIAGAAGQAAIGFGSASDVVLSRTAADVLSMAAGDALAMPGGSVVMYRDSGGAPTDADFPAAARVNGAGPVVDRVNSRVWFRTGGSWKFATLT